MKRNTVQYFDLLEIPQPKNNSILLSTELDVLVVYDVHVQSTTMLIHYTFYI